MNSVTGNKTRISKQYIQIAKNWLEVMMESMNLKTGNKARDCKQDRDNVSRGTLVMVDKDKLAKRLRTLFTVEEEYIPPLELCYDAISACEVGMKPHEKCREMYLEHGTLNTNWKVALRESYQRARRAYLKTWDPYHGEVKSEGDAIGCEWVDDECFVNPHRCSLAKAGICQVYALHGKGEHEKVKSGEHASG